MTVIELYGVLRRYGVDVLLLALGVTLLTSLLKKTVMKSVGKKVFVFLPFGLGILIYALYSISTRGCAAFVGGEWTSVLGGGLSTGSAATLYYVFYEQLLRGKIVMDPLEPLLTCVPEDKRAEASAAISEAFAAEKEDRLSAISAQLEAFCDPPLPKEELLCLASVLEGYLTALP